MNQSFLDFIEITNIFTELIQDGRKTSDKDVRVQVQKMDYDPLHNYKLQEFMEEIADAVVALPGFEKIAIRMLNKRDSFDGWRLKYERRR